MERMNDIKHAGKELTVYGRIAFALSDFCSGSGFDCDWYFQDMGKYVKACTDFHVMNNNGYYVGYCAFKVIVPKKNPGDFRWYGMQHSKRILQRYGIDDYIDQSVYSALETNCLAGTVWEARKATLQDHRTGAVMLEFGHV